MDAFGLDLSDSLIRLALIEHPRKGWRLPVRGEIPVEPGLIVEGEIRKPDSVSRLIAQLVKAAGPKSHQAIVSLPERHTFLKLISISNQTGSMADAIKASASQHVPYAWDEIYFDWSVLPEKNSLGEQQVMLAAAPRSLVDSYMEALTAAGLEPISYEIESLAIARATLTKEQQKETYIVLDLGKTRSTLMLADHGVVKFSTTVRYAGKDLTTFIADELKISKDQAEKAKTLFGLDPVRGKGLLRQVLAPHIDALAKKVAEAEDFYTDHGDGQGNIAGVILTGSGAMLRGIDQELAARLQHPVKLQPSWIIEELQRVDPEITVEIGYTYSNVIGLALQNFLP